MFGSLFSDLIVKFVNGFFQDQKISRSFTSAIIIFLVILLFDLTFNVSKSVMTHYQLYQLEKIESLKNQGFKNNDYLEKTEKFLTDTDHIYDKIVKLYKSLLEKKNEDDREFVFMFLSSSAVLCLMVIAIFFEVLIRYEREPFFLKALIFWIKVIPFIILTLFFTYLSYEIPNFKYNILNYLINFSLFNLILFYGLYLVSKGYGLKHDKEMIHDSSIGGVGGSAPTNKGEAASEAGAKKGTERG